MIKMILAQLFVVATVYNAVPEQTDSSPLITASGAKINANYPEQHDG